MAGNSDKEFYLGRDLETVDKDLIFNVGNGATNARFRGNYTTKRLQFSNDGVNFFDIGIGDSEEAQLFNNLALNGMEAGMMTSFSVSKEDFVRTTSNLSLNGEGNYVPSATSTSTTWIGNRLPDSGAASEIWTATGTGVATVNTPGFGELQIVDDASGLKNYFQALPTGIATGDLFCEYEFKTTVETTPTAYGSDVSFHNMVIIADGSRDVRIVPIRQTNASGERQIVIGSSAVDVANDLDTGLPLRMAVDWSQYHNYKLYKKGSVLYIYVDDVYRGRVDTATLSSTSTLRITFGTQSNPASAGTHIWKKFSFNAYRSSVETKTLNYRGTFAYEGDGDPTSATVPAGSVSDPSVGYVFENNWVQWTASSNGTVTETQLATGLPESSRQLAMSPSSSRHYSRVFLGGADAQNLSIQAEVVFTALNLGTGTAFNMLNFRVPNLRAQLWCSKVTNNTVSISIGNQSAPAVGVGVGTPVTVGLNEVNVYELRKVGSDIIQFLFNGKIQQEITTSEFDFNHASGTSDFFWGNSTAIGAGDSVTWRWDYVRCTHGKDPFLPRATVKEFLAISNNDDADPYVSFTSDNITWTYPVKLNDLGVSPLVTTPQSRSGGYVAARVMLSASAGSVISTLSVLYNASQGLPGLKVQAIKIYTALELPSAPQDAVFNHGLGVADDEIMVFGNSDYLIKDVNWFYNSANSITLVAAQVGVRYTVRRIGFSFDRSDENSSRISELETDLSQVENDVTALQGRNINAGNGLAGGGSLAADVTVTMGNPSTITISTTNSVTATSHTHALTLPSTLGAVGTYAMLSRFGSNATITQGTDLAGSNLRYSGFLVRDVRTNNGWYPHSDNGSVSPAGTWRAMGRLTQVAENDQTDASWRFGTMWLRIS